jgi:hypothetical protein
MMECLVEESDGEPSASPGIGPCCDGAGLRAGEFQEGAEVVAGFPQGGLGCEGLEEEEPEGALQGKDPLAAVGAGSFAMEEIVRKERGEEVLQFRDGFGAYGTKAAAEGGQGMAKTWEEGSIHRAVTLPPY